MKGIPQMGCHLILDFHGTTKDVNNFSELDKNFRRIIEESGATIETCNYKLFEPQGISIAFLRGLAAVLNGATLTNKRRVPPKRPAMILPRKIAATPTVAAEFPTVPNLWPKVPTKPSPGAFPTFRLSAENTNAQMPL